MRVLNREDVERLCRGVRTTPGAKGMRILCIVALLATVASGAEWEVIAGDWNTSAGTGRNGMLLSRDWYGDLEFSGELSASSPPAIVAILVRYAGPSESYSVVVDWSHSRISLRENHFGAERELTGEALPRGSQTLRFHITAAQERLSARFDDVTMNFAGLAVPEGRVGLSIDKGEMAFRSLQLSGETQSRFPTYAFRCNYRLPDKVARHPLWLYLDAAGEVLLNRYRRDYQSVADFETYRKKAIQDMRRSLGLEPWPERTPLNARVVGMVDRGDFKIEKVIFESQPGFLVDALLYLPKTATFPVPGILNTIGHYGDDGFFIWSEQGRAIGLARKGYVVLTYDPIGQGERKWLGNGNHDTLRRKIILSGMEVSGLMFWDSIRAIDYLSSRPEVDPSRIGVTGVSGGGFNALYTAALDERVQVVAPDGFATSLEGLIKRADAGCCAYLPNLARYAEIPDIYSFIAPRKLLILGGYMDVLSDRLLQVYAVSSKVYHLYRADERVGYFMDKDAGHTYSKPMRLAMYRFFNKWLKGNDDPAQVAEPHDPEDNLISRASGLLSVFAPGEKGVDVIDLERAFLARHRVRASWPDSRDAAGAFQERVRQRLLDLLGESAKTFPVEVLRDDKRGGVRHVVLKVERMLPVPVAIHKAARHPFRGVIVYFTIQDRYRASDLTAGEVVDRLIAAGFDVVLPEVRGSGATRVEDMNSVALYSMALGRPLFAARIGDLRAVLDWLLVQPEYRSAPLAVWGEGPREGLMALYMAAVDPRVIQVVASHGLVTYQDIVDKDGLPDFDWYIPGVLQYLDVPEIISAVAPRRVIISAPIDINNSVLDCRSTERQYAQVRRVYDLLGAKGELVILPQADVGMALASFRPAVPIRQPRRSAGN